MKKFFGYLLFPGLLGGFIFIGIGLTAEPKDQVSVASSYAMTRDMQLIRDQAERAFSLGVPATANPYQGCPDGRASYLWLDCYMNAMERALAAE